MARNDKALCIRSAFAVFVVAAGAIGQPLDAWAGARENALNHLAQAFAVTKVCPRAEVVQSAMVLVAVGNGVDFDRDAQELMTQISAQAAPFQGRDPEIACTIGMALYGPDGSNVPGLLNWK